MPNDHDYTNYIAYRDPKSHKPRIGYLDLDASTIQPLGYLSGAPLSDLYEVIEIGETQIAPSGEVFPLLSVQVLPPISGRDVLAVGKNYFEHAIEFNNISIIAHGDEIFPHPGFTETPDYEGEIGVIIGKDGFQIPEEAAMDHVWGYTIINDMTARERQRDHKQFFIGKSPDTFCPMGPIAVPASKLPKTLRVRTNVNGEQRQDSTTNDLIFSIPFLVKTLSAGQTLQAGDVLATGTPAGVGFGQKPPVFLKEGDLVEISVTGLGTLRNNVGSPKVKNITARLPSHIPIFNKKLPDEKLTSINSKQLHYRKVGRGDPIFFIHGLGTSSEYFASLVSALDLEKNYELHLLDLEGHGLSPTSATSKTSIQSYSSDVQCLIQRAGLIEVTVVAHGMGCLIALMLAARNPQLVKRQLLLDSPASFDRKLWMSRAAAARDSGMATIVDSVVSETSSNTQKGNLLAIAAIRLSLLGQDPEGFAKGCTAIAEFSDELALGEIKTETLIVTGDDETSKATREKYTSQISGAKIEVLSGVGHWHIYEDMDGVKRAVSSFL